MYYGEIKNCDIANGVGVRVSLFVSGCTNHCEQCFQPETWDFTYGKPFTRQTEETLLSLLAPSYIDGLTLLGGEPFEPTQTQCFLGNIYDFSQKEYFNHLLNYLRNKEKGGADYSKVIKAIEDKI